MGIELTIKILKMMKKRINVNYELVTIKRNNRIKKFRRRIGWISRYEVNQLYAMGDEELELLVRGGKLKCIIQKPDFGISGTDLFNKLEVEEWIMAERKSLEEEMDVLISELQEEGEFDFHRSDFHEKFG